MSPDLRALLSRDACANMLDHLEKLGARHVMAYASMGDELDTWGLMAELLRRGVCVYLPRVLKERRMAALKVTELNALEKGAFGVMAPRHSEEMADEPPTQPLPMLDVVIVPGLAFDRAGFRLGYGAGYYDRFLPGGRARTIGLAFDCQVLDAMPHAAWDVPVDVIVTETGTLRCGEV